MKKTLLVSILFLSVSISAVAQKTINNYKYVIIPLKFDFLSEKDQYRLNTLTRHLFKQKGFIALFDKEEFPEELIDDRCKALFADVEKEKSGLFSTRVNITLKDCLGKDVYKTETGSSREKDFKKAYNEALKSAFSSIEFLDYKYKPAEAKVEKGDDEMKELAVNVDKVKTETQTEDIKVSTKNGETALKDETLYAQEKEYGYQVVDATPKVVMQLMKTTATNVYIVKDQNAIVYKEDGFWYYSENNGELKEPKTLDIKF
ncbi:hypothetical protein BWZ20_12080 [Winogradskyella sp. J14-2]|uniref:hypothetical protein n=1 Tax=Winogradskyella sp. J14-2 TaxID=1936080 RepID=UPI00097266AE|nr:hypothetical protein [Winogradskyella sp. J14-2]APY08989.1 hypothetical protein BWZ20_12080 [Winogradskyella sp. J14-2]